MITYRQLEKYSYISFDVFDTLIRRSVARPEDLFELMEMFGAPKTFSQKRRDAERLAGEELGRHASLDEIYERMEEGSKSFKELEIQLEIDGCQPNPHYAALFRQCVEAGKTVLLITDMYLSADVIGQMLKKCGLVGYHKLYISSEQAAQKSDGTLYHKILHDLQIKPGQLCHIGDNLNGDVIKPHSQGMGAVWARKKRKYACYIPRDAAGNDALMHRTMQACVRNARERLSEVEQQGCTVLGPLLYGFTVWLAQMLQSDGIHEVYFLSREGLVLKRAFDSLRIPGIKTHYLYGSRKAYIVPLLWKCESIEEALFYITSSDSMTMRMFFVQIGLDPDHYIDLLAEYGIEMDRRYARATFTGSEAIQKVFKRIMPDIEAESKREYESVTSYLHDLQMGGGIALVDIGYHGTMQNALQSLLKMSGVPAEVNGFYLGITPNDARFTKYGLKGSGYLYDTHHGKEIWDVIQSTMIPLLEAQFLAPHGSVDRFIQSKGHVVPAFCEFEYTKNESMYIDEKEYIRRYTEGALTLMRYMADVFHGQLLQLAPAVASYEIRRMGYQPTLQEARLWGDFRFINYGKISYLARPRKISFYLLHPRTLVRDLHASEVWKTGFLKRLFVLPLPYGPLYMRLQHILKKAR